MKSEFILFYSNFLILSFVIIVSVTEICLKNQEFYNERSEA